jgi:hypothetical protein
MVRRLAVLGLVALGVNFAWIVGWVGFNLNPLPLAIYLIFDTAVWMLIAVFMLVIQRSNLLAVALAAIIPALFLSASWMKFLLLGTSAQFGDVILLPDLYRALPWERGLLLLGVLAVSVGAFLANLRPGIGVAAIIMIAAAAVVPSSRAAFSAVATRLAQSLPTRIGDFPNHGHFLHAVYATVAAMEWNNLSALSGPPLRQRQLPSADGLLAERRNVHILVLESFIDPRSLPGFAWSDEPLTTLLTRARDAATGHASTPVFGNRSSNTEFEVLCGLPATVGHSGMAFGLIPEGARLECLPRILGRAGYATASLVPNSPGFFWAARAFGAAGFDRSLFGPDLDMADMDGDWLSAEATLRQLRDLGEALGIDRPRLLYSFVNAGHYPYIRDRARRPDRLTVAPHLPVVHNWANSAHHTALAVENHVAGILRNDPDALIVVLGDHNPPLGSDFAGYRLGRRIPQDETASPLSRAYMYRTLLMVLDRGRLVETGGMPAWHVPHLVLDLLSDGATCAAHACPHREEPRLRPLPDYVLVLDRDGAERRRCSWTEDAEMSELACREPVADAKDLVRALNALLASRAP